MSLRGRGSAGRTGVVASKNENLASTSTDTTASQRTDGVEANAEDSPAAKPRARNWKTMERTNYREFKSLRRGEVKTLFDQKYGGEEITISRDGYLSPVGIPGLVLSASV
jgi:hypothetical protein